MSVLAGAAVLVPPTAAPGEVERLRRHARDGACRAARLCPGEHGYPLAPWVVSPLPELCAREGLSLLLDFGPERIRWQEVVPFARAYPTVPMAVLGGAAGDLAAPAALDHAANLLLELDRVDDAAQVVRLVGVFGPSRFIAGERARELVGAALDEPARGDLLERNAAALASGAYAGAHL